MKSDTERCQSIVCLVATALLLGGCAASTGNLRLAAENPQQRFTAQADEPSPSPSPSPSPDADADGVLVPMQVELVGDVDDALIESESQDLPGALTERVLEERQTAFNPYVITAHKQNFILPVSYSTGINEAIYRQNDVPLREGLQPAEVKFQISLKAQLNEKDLLFTNDALAVGITLEAWWQLYSSDLSSPFRETNYQPEVFYLVPLLWGPFGGNTALLTGLEHQSNGQVQGLSRSWNRVYAALLYEKGHFVASIRPWYRLPESPKRSPEEPKGDDNPDILDFMGHAELSSGWRNGNYEYGLTLRGNPDTGKGAVKLGMTFPFFSRFRGFVQFFSGYGDSLIDYDHFQTRLGLGVTLTNMF